MTKAEISRAEQELPEIADVGVPNYFDDQRFGSVPNDGAFVAREMVLGNFEAALRIALAAPYEHDRSDAKLGKAILNGAWGRWAMCKSKLPRSHARSIVDYLVHHPTDFRGACARLRPELQGLYLSAWQSHLWNKMLDRWLRERLSADQYTLVRLKTAEVAMPRSMPENLRDEWDRLMLPLPSARLKLDPEAPWAHVVQAVMAEEGIPIDQMRIRGMQKPYFSKGDRRAKVPVADLSWVVGEDELNRGRRKLELRFKLPRGCYATMVVKRVSA
jgi:tRNA pseudouridine13 synthase